MKAINNDLSATLSFRVFPEHLNPGGTLFGGKVLEQMDIAASMVVRRALYGTDSDSQVTASVERVDFKSPGYQDDFIELVSKIKLIGRSSIQVRVDVTREDKKGERSDICSANFTFVALKGGKPYQHGLYWEKT